MIDLHSHILPDLDDGARTLEEALAMARIAVADGITVIAATPHSPESTMGKRYRSWCRSGWSSYERRCARNIFRWML